MVHVREYHPDDAFQVERCVIELQVYERTIEPNRADPTSIARPYLAHLLEQCQDQDGAIFVAEAVGAIVGFVCVLARLDSGSLIEVERDYAYISDLVVQPTHRGQGIGRAGHLPGGRLPGARDSFAETPGDLRRPDVRQPGNQLYNRACYPRFSLLDSRF